jgi:CBS domain-containing membrane protein
MRATPFINWLEGFLPGPLSARRQEWPRAAIGAACGILIAALVCQQLFGTPVMRSIIGPLGASAVLLFGVSSGALAQPWSLFGSYTLATLVATATGHLLDHSLASACLAAGLSLVLMYPLRCLHPPGGAMALCVVLAGPTLADLGPAVLLPVWTHAGCLLLCALLYNNLSGVRYPRRPQPAPDLHQTRDPLPAARVGIQTDDLNRALEEFGSFVDVTRDDLEQLIRQTEKHALRRSMGNLQAAQIMSRDLRWATPETRLSQAWEIFSQHRLRIMPILDDGRLVGIVSLVDLMRHMRQTRRPRLLGGRGEVRMAEVMSSPVLSVPVHADVVELIPLLSGQGLHCLPVLDDGRLVGMITQTDLIAALHRNLIMQLG